MKQSKRLLTILTWVIAAVLMVPFLWSLLLSLKTDAEISLNPLSLPDTLMLDNYTRALKTLPLITMYKNTAIILVGTVILGLSLPFMSSFACTRLVFKHKRLQSGLYGYLLLGQMIPAYVLLFPIYRVTISLRLVGSLLSVILPLTATNIAFNTLMYVGFLKDFPTEIEEAALIDGCSLPHLLCQVTLPIIKPVIATIFIFNVLYVWNEYPLTVTLISKPSQYTISLGASMFKGQYSTDYGGMVAGCMLIVVPQLLFYAFFQRSIIDGMTTGAIKG